MFKETDVILRKQLIYDKMMKTTDQIRWHTLSVKKYWIFPISTHFQSLAPVLNFDRSLTRESSKIPKLQPDYFLDSYIPLKAHWSRTFH